MLQDRPAVAMGGAGLTSVQLQYLPALCQSVRSERLSVLGHGKNQSEDVMLCPPSC